MITAKQYGPWAVIPGGSEGVGAAFARKLAKAGIKVDAAVLAKAEADLKKREAMRSQPKQAGPAPIPLRPVKPANDSGKN